MSFLDASSSPGQPEPIFQRLPINPDRYPDEDERGYFARLSDLNGFNDAMWLLRSRGITAHGICRLCPVCMDAATPYWRTAWNSDTTPWCQVHKCLLVDICQGCRLPIRWKRALFASCRCGFMWAKSARTPINKCLLHASSASPTIPLEVLIWLGAIAVHGTLSKPLKQASKHAVCDVLRYLECGANVAIGWPDSFYAVLDQHRVPPTSGDALQLLNTAFPRLICLIKKILDKTWTERVRLAVGEYVNRSLLTDRPITGRNTKLVFQTQSQKSVANGLGIRTERLVSLLDAKMSIGIPSRSTRMGRRRRYLSSSLIESLAASADHAVSNQRTAEFLEISPSRIRQIPNSLLNRTDRSLILQSSLHKLSDDLIKRAVAFNESSSDFISVRHALRYLISQELTAEFFHFLMRDEVELRRSSDGSKVGALLIKRTAILNWRNEPEGEGRFFTIPEATTLLGLKQQVVYALVQKRLIKTETAKFGLRTVKAISFEEIEIFKRTYAPLIELAKLSHVCSKDAFDWATEIGLPVITGPCIDGARQYFSLLVTRSGIRFNMNSVWPKRTN